jgi:hypothetical protein
VSAIRRRPARPSLPADETTCVSVFGAFRHELEGREAKPLRDKLAVYVDQNIQHTVLYTQLAADRFNGFWDD